MLSLTQFAQHLERAIAMTKPMLEVGLAEIGEHTKKAAVESIGQELSRWPALAESTIAEKQRLGFVGQVSATDPLLRTGELRNSIRFSVHGLTQEVGSTSKIGLMQEMGTAKMPPRPFIAPAAIEVIPFAHHVLGKVAVQLLTPKVR